MPHSKDAPPPRLTATFFHPVSRRVSTSFTVAITAPESSLPPSREKRALGRRLPALRGS